MILSQTRACFVALAVCLAAAAAEAEVLVTLGGTLTSPTLSLTVDNGDVFSSGGSDILTFFQPPNASGALLIANGPLGGINPNILRAPANGSYLNLLRISTGNGSTNLVLSQANPYISSGALVNGSVSSFQPLHGVVTTMSLFEGQGPATTTVRFNYAVGTVPEPASLLLAGGLALAVAGRRRRRV